MILQAQEHAGVDVSAVGAIVALYFRRGVLRELYKSSQESKHLVAYQNNSTTWFGRCQGSDVPHYQGAEFLCATAYAVEKVCSRYVPVVGGFRDSIVFGFDPHTFGGARTTQGFRHQYDVSPDGQRFLININVPVAEGSGSRITLVLNWTAGLKK
jgi:hypothetical protein